MAIQRGRIEEKGIRPNFELGHVFIVRKTFTQASVAVQADQVDVWEDGRLFFYTNEGKAIADFAPGEWMSFTNH